MYEYLIHTKILFSVNIKYDCTDFILIAIPTVLYIHVKSCNLIIDDKFEI